MLSQPIFTFLDAHYFSLYFDPKGMTLKEELACLHLLEGKVERPEDLIERRATLEANRNYKSLAHKVHLFQIMFSSTFTKEIEDSKFSLKTCLSIRPLEDWIFFYLEIYFWKNRKGREIFLSVMKENKLFQKEVDVFYNESTVLFSLDRKLKFAEAQTDLEGLLRKLKINQVSLRRNAESFVEVLNSFHTDMDKKTHDWMMVHLPTERSNWFLKWYIFDRGLFANDILEYYEISTGTDLKNLKEEQLKIKIDSIFSILVISLLQGEIREWLHIHNIDFKSKILKIENFVLNKI